ncbi:MAG: hypothetical protein KAJ81_03140 [Candidatus Latescibacteria bacterium]|nr:hypothetical protein [Candidatus Latescibacterota bacterium]
MQKDHDAIEELIETSYLLGKSEQEIREDLAHFVGLCRKTLSTQVQDKKKMNVLAAKLNRIKEEVLADRTMLPKQAERVWADGTAMSATEWLAERTARNKRLVLRAIEECDPQLVALIQKERFGEPAHSFDAAHGKRPIIADARNTLRSNRRKLLFLKIAYIIAVIGVFLLVALTIQVGR